jgi:hypothetical protein
MGEISGYHGFSPRRVMGMPPSPSRLLSQPLGAMHPAFKGFSLSQVNSFFPQLCNPLESWEYLALGQRFATPYTLPLSSDLDILHGR